VIVENGTREDERAAATTLADLTDCVSQLGLRAPAVIFVGLDWAGAGLQRPKHVAHYRRLPRHHRRADQPQPVTAEVSP
jgi:uroporphyrin-III C-methyltransferase/precorrin-2 dehydrogenase/sirohydrochlorin ferrochelatase